MPKKSLLYIGNKLSRRGRNPTSVETLGPLLKAEGFSVFSASSVPNKFLRLFDMLFKTFLVRKKINVVLIDVYSTQNFWYAVAVARLCRALKLPYVPVLHGGNLPERLHKNPRVAQKLFANAKMNVAPSEYLYQKFRAEGFTNLNHIPNALELSNYPFKQRTIVKAKLLWVRAFAEIYNPMLALAVVEELLARNVEVSLCMVGPEKDGMLEKCKQRVKERGLPVSFSGKLEKTQWLERSKQFDIFINTTNVDNLPLSVIEAMALGLPVISTNAGGLPFLIDNGKTGLLVSQNEPNEFAKAIISLIENPEFATALSLQGRQKAETFDWEKTKPRWLALLAT